MSVKLVILATFAAIVYSLFIVAVTRYLFKNTGKETPTDDDILGI